MTWEDDLSPEERQSWDAFVKHTREDTVQKMASSAMVASIVPDSEDFDVKFALETGVAIWLDKPIVLLVNGGVRIPPKLLKVADAVVEVDDIDTEEGQAEARRKLLPIIKRYSEGDDDG